VSVIEPFVLPMHRGTHGGRVGGESRCRASDDDGECPTCKLPGVIFPESRRRRGEDPAKDGLPPAEEPSELGLYQRASDLADTDLGSREAVFRHRFTPTLWRDRDCAA